MAEVIIKTDGTVEGTSLTVDGVNITETCNCTSINMYAGAPYKSSYNGERMPGYVSVSYDCCNGSGVIERKSLMSTEKEDEEGIGHPMMEDDSVGKASKALRFIGKAVDVEVANIVDKIVEHCSTSKIACPTKEILLVRSIESLKDKAEDLGIKLE